MFSHACSLPKTTITYQYVHNDHGEPDTTVITTDPSPYSTYFSARPPLVQFSIPLINRALPFISNLVTTFTTVVV